MKIKQVKVAQTIPGSSSNILTEKDYHLSFDKGILTVKHRTSAKYGSFMVFPANIAFIEYVEATAAEQEEGTESSEDAKRSPGRPKKA